MHARIVVNIILLALVIVLMVYLTQTDAPIPEGQLSVPLSTIDPAAVNHMQISRPGKPDLVLQKSGTDWQITSPISIAANPFRTSSLLALLQTRSLSTISADPASFGLTDSQVTLAFDKQVFRFGDVNPLDQSRYILHNNTIHLVEDNLYDQLLQDAAFYADNHLLSTQTALVRITFTDWELANISNAWIQVSGNPVLAVTDISGMAGRWQQLEALRVTAADTTIPPVDIILETAAGEKIELSTLAVAPELLLQRIDAGIVYHFPAQTAIDLGITRSAN